MKSSRPIDQLVESFKKLPSVGTKSAERFVYAIMDMSEEEVNDFATALLEVKHKMKYCNICGHITMDDTCELCEDQTRNHNQILVVSHPKDVIAIEKTAEYKGVYHVLHGLISTTKGILPQDIQIDELLKRINQDTEEVIIATNPTLDGETTALYISKLLEQKNINVTRLAHGLPMGGHLDYADELTLIKALEGRKKI